MLKTWFFLNVKFDLQSFDQNVWSKKELDIFNSAQRIISEHEAKIPFNQTAAAQEEQEMAALKAEMAALKERAGKRAA
jgi:hypothetical protein